MTFSGTGFENPDMDRDRQCYIMSKDVFGHESSKKWF